jgi:hypothetical protein
MDEASALTGQRSCCRIRLCVGVLRRCLGQLNSLLIGDRPCPEPDKPDDHVSGVLLKVTDDRKQALRHAEGPEFRN